MSFREKSLIWMEWISTVLPECEKKPRLMGSWAHGLCGQDNPWVLCLQNGQYSKCFRSDFRNETITDALGCPKYWRHNTGRTVAKHIPVKSVLLLDNRLVITYNPYLCQKYNCLINVENAGSIRSMKYLHKYIHKGHDAADFLITEQQHDEVIHYTNNCHVAALEACWHIFKFPMHNTS